MAGSKAIRTLGLLLALAPAALATTWLVDGAGAGDFTTIGAAIAAAQPGDLVIVKPGSTYPPFTLDKRLSILGEGFSAPPVSGLVSITSTEGAVIAGLRFQRLQVLGCTGLVLLDKVTVNDSQSQGCPCCVVDACANVVMQNSHLQAPTAPAACTSEALIVRGSHVVVVQTELDGGAGLDGPTAGGTGLPAVLVDEAAFLQLAHCELFGGPGGTALLPGGVGGTGGPALRVVAPSTLVIDNHNDAFLEGGPGGVGSVPGAPAPFLGEGDGSISLSGITFLPAAWQPSLAMTVPSPLHAFIRQFDAPQNSKLLQLYGPAGQSQFLLGSLVLASFSLPALVDGPIYLDPTTAFLFTPVTTLGLNSAVEFTFEVPVNPALSGLVVPFQCFSAQPGPPPWRATNPTYFVLH
jgi:hypothetical protein